MRVDVQNPTLNLTLTSAIKERGALSPGYSRRFDGGRVGVA